ncbi:hypothetical protein C8Q73DRAFT_118669 [Cubamyces lactineus]|nr:hypothetical protein C8Q73DRAFT_118669 [Cubamyces lactineus]
MDIAKRRDPPTGSTSIPQDIIYDIIDHLQHDTAALSKCSVVCRAWLHPSRRHLFRAVTVYHGSASVQNRRGLAAFVDFLRACVDARHFLQHLTLSSEIWRPQAGIPDFDTALPLDIDEFFAILDTAVNIQHLTLTDVSWTDNAAWAAPHPRRTLKRLDVEEWIGSDQEVLQVLKLIGAFERLDLLTLSLFAERSYTEDTTGLFDNHAQTGHFPSVHSFRYYTSPEWCATPLYQTIARSCCRGRDTLARITFRIWDYADSWKRITEFCGFVCDTDVRFHIRELDFDPGNGSTLWSTVSLPDWGVLDLSRLEELVHLTLALNCEDAPTIGQELSKKLNTYAYIFRTHPPPALRNLVIKLHVPDGTYDDDRKPRVETLQRASYRPAWSTFDGALNALPTSPQVVFDCVELWGEMVDREAIDQCFKELLPQVHARGLLQ